MSYRGNILRELDFTSEEKDGSLQFWSESAETDRHQRFEVGRARAIATIRFIAEHQDPLILKNICRDVLKKKEPDDLAVGFFQGISEKLILP